MKAPRTFSLEWGFDDRLRRVCTVKWGGVERRCTVALNLGPLHLDLALPLVLGGVQTVTPEMQTARERREALRGPLAPIDDKIHPHRASIS